MEYCMKTFSRPPFLHKLLSNRQNRNVRGPARAHYKKINPNYKQRKYSLKSVCAFFANIEFVYLHKIAFEYLPPPHTKELNN